MELIAVTGSEAPAHEIVEDPGVLVLDGVAVLLTKVRPTNPY